MKAKNKINMNKEYELLKKQTKIDNTITGITSVGAGIGTGMICRKGFNKGWGTTIFLSVLASGATSILVYNCVENVIRNK